jgi:carotenoid cleavage dioxygenase-like enzyme
MDRRVDHGSGFDVQLRQQFVQTNAFQHMANAKADRALLIMRTHGDGGVVKARVADTGHGQKKATGQESWVGHQHCVYETSAGGKLTCPTGRSKPRSNIARAAITSASSEKGKELLYFTSLAARFSGR